MKSFNMNLIKEINLLWTPVYPYLAKQIEEVYGRKDGDILDIGPFCGLIFNFIENNIGNSFTIGTFPEGMGLFFLEEARKKGFEKMVRILETDPSLKGIENQKIDLAIFRGAFFFPSLFEVDFKAIDRVLKPKGVAFIGGGFGKFTPEEIIRKIGKRSRQLNLEIGKIEISENEILKNISKATLKANFEIIKEGGLWVLLRKD
jgi:SAM-dependent methyltransferase